MYLKYRIIFKPPSSWIYESIIHIPCMMFSHLRDSNSQFSGGSAITMNMFRILRTQEKMAIMVKLSLHILTRFRMYILPIINLDHCSIQRWKLCQREMYQKFKKLNYYLFLLAIFSQRRSKYLKIYQFHWCENSTLLNHAKNILLFKNFLIFN